MTAPKINTIKRGDSRFYVGPVTGEKVPGVTSVLNMLPKGFLTYWAAKMVAECFADDPGTAVNLVLRDRAAAVEYLKKAPQRSTGESARIGSEAHALFETLAKGHSVGRVHPDLDPYVRHFSEFLDTAQPEFLYLEETVWSETHGYAGSFDWLARIDGELVWGDNKTTRSGIHAEVGVQLAAYAAADYIILPDGTHLDLPQSETGAVFHVRPEGWSLTPVRADRALFEEVFLPLLKVFKYERETKDSIVGRPAFHGPLAEAPKPAPERRAPRAKAAAK